MRTVGLWQQETTWELALLQVTLDSLVVEEANRDL
jgi:hypothetical protein